MLRLQLRVDVLLDAVEHQRLDGAALAADAQQLGREKPVVGVEPLARRAAARVASASPRCGARSAGSAGAGSTTKSHTGRLRVGARSSRGSPSWTKIKRMTSPSRTLLASILATVDWSAPTRRASSAWVKPRSRRARRISFPG